MTYYMHINRVDQGGVYKKRTFRFSNSIKMVGKTGAFKTQKTINLLSNLEIVPK